MRQAAFCIQRGDIMPLDDRQQVPVQRIDIAFWFDLLVVFAAAVFAIAVAADFRDAQHKLWRDQRRARLACVCLCRLVFCRVRGC